MPFIFISITCVTVSCTVCASSTDSCRNRNRRRCNGWILSDGQLWDRQCARHHQNNGQHPYKYRSSNKVCHVRLPCFDAKYRRSIVVVANLFSRTRFCRPLTMTIARFQTFANQPFIANRLTGNDRARFHLTLSLTISTVASPRGVRLTPCCGIRIASGWTPSSIRAHKHTRQKRMLQVEEDST